MSVNLTIVFNSPRDISFDLPLVLYTQIFKSDPVYFRICKSLGSGDLETGGVHSKKPRSINDNYIYRYDSMNIM